MCDGEKQGPFLYVKNTASVLRLTHGLPRQTKEPPTSEDTGCTSSDRCTLLGRGRAAAPAALGVLLLRRTARLTPGTFSTSHHPLPSLSSRKLSRRFLMLNDSPRNRFSRRRSERGGSVPTESLWSQKHHRAPPRGPQTLPALSRDTDGSETRVEERWRRRVRSCSYLPPPGQGRGGQSLFGSSGQGRGRAHGGRAPFLTATHTRTHTSSGWGTGMQSTSHACLWGVGGTESPEKARRQGRTRQLITSAP